MKPKLEQTLSHYVGRQAHFDLRPGISAIEEWLAEQLALSFAADAGGVTTPLGKMGDGWQSLVRIAALDVLSQYPDEMGSRVVLLFEEPESFLHPHLARKLRGVLEALASAGWTVAVTTHSPNLVNFSGRQSILKLTRRGNVVTACCLETPQVEEAAKFQERMDERGTHEMLFAQKAVIVEGQDDVFALRSYLCKRAGMDVDLDGRSISIVRAGDVGQLPAFASIASRLGIPWFAISDEDLQADGTIKQPTASSREKLTNLQKPCDGQAFWKQDLEACLDKTQGKANPEWQAEHIDTKSTDDLRTQNPHYVSVCESAKAWFLGPSDASMVEPPGWPPGTVHS
jgi:predicted ATP-dependent endonuclease of OLD family